jgi:hypothetical protein
MVASGWNALHGWVAMPHEVFIIVPAALDRFLRTFACATHVMVCCGAQYAAAGEAEVLQLCTSSAAGC